MLGKRLFSLFTAAALLCAFSGCSNSADSAASESASAETEVPEMRDISTTELVQDMGIGINLGNTFESCGDWIEQWGDGSVESYETAWGSPVITQEMIEGYAAEGFGVLRIPVAWSNLMAPDYTISPEYLKRVMQVTDWAMDTGMYVIVNIHYDGGWFADFSTQKDTCMQKYTRIWEQLSDAFQDYNDHLMLESLNEEGCWDDIWNRYSGDDSQKKEAYDLLLEINQTFVDTVRASGGNNAKRHLLIAGYATDIDLTCDELFRMPEDPEHRMAVSVHYYAPAGFAILEEDADWGKARPQWGSPREQRELAYNLDKMTKAFSAKGIPVIIGEYGCPKKNKAEDSVRLYLSSVCREASARGFCPILWDVTDSHYDRTTCKMTDPQLKTDLFQAAEEGRETFHSGTADSTAAED
ncbi:glycoside hydrolase family 5 protein [uncultured Ruminococcus sp.]|uniref:glycoside hydrolase family 5 protein n=1 Tax=uncultured Ruminococcus sp. TaxID=165186 RepID=UPI0025D891FD|nr:glycoside hydrolase family 5 protein [uncultured Ruminococcus sp.]